MMVDAPVIANLEDLEPGTLFYLPSLGEGALCVAARWKHSSNGTIHAVILTETGGPSTQPGIPSAVQIERLNGNIIILSNYFANVDLNSACVVGLPKVVANRDGLYLCVIDETNNRRALMGLHDGLFVSSVPEPQLGFRAWQIVNADDPENVIWSSNVPDVVHGG